MSEMASWFETRDGGYIFLTDADVIAYHENKGEGREAIYWPDMVGHSGIMKVFGLPDRYTHHEGFVDMPDVIRKNILDRKMNSLFCNAGNLEEATPEFIPLMRCFANINENVRESLNKNPYKNCKGDEKITIEEQMKVGIKTGFKGSTIGKLLRSPYCTERAMLLALTTPSSREVMDHGYARHHFLNILNNPSVSKKVLEFLVADNKVDSFIVSEAALKLKNFRKWTPTKQLKGVKVQFKKRGKAIIRRAVMA